MKQPIAGVAPQELGEVAVMTVWPSNAAYALGRLLGRLYSIKVGFSICTVGNLLALASIPVALAIYFCRLAPKIGMRYRLTNRRIIVQRGLMGIDERWVELDRFDSIEIVVQPGQSWYDAGNLVFRNDNAETFRLAGVSRPQAFRQTCLNSRLAYTEVRKALE